MRNHFPSFQIPGTNFYADGYMENENERRVLEVYGCFYHQHECSYDEDSSCMGRPAWEIRKRDKERVTKLRQLGYAVEVVHECEIREQLKASAEMKEFFDTCEFAVSKTFLILISASIRNL